MKKIFTTALTILLAFTLSLNAQDARQRTTDTIVADVLAAMPAQTSDTFNAQMADLAAAAPSSVLMVASKLKEPAAGVKNNIYEYALTGLSAYASGNPAVAAKVSEGFAQAIKAASDDVTKAFLLTQFRPLAKASDVDFLKGLTAQPALVSLALGALENIPESESAVLDLVKEAKLDKALLADAASRLNISAAEPYLQQWAAASEGAELRAVTSALAKVGSASSLDILKKSSIADYAALTVALADGSKSKAVAKAAKSLLGSEVSAYKSAGALAQMKNAPAKALKTLVSALGSDDIKFRNSVINDATSLVGTDAVAALLAAKYAKASDATKVDILNWMGNNKVADASKLVCAAVGQGGDIAEAAIKAAGKIGDSDCLAAIVSKLGGENSGAAFAALKSFKGDIEPAVASILDGKIGQIGANGKCSEADAAALTWITSIVSGRRLTGLAPRLLTLAQSGDATVASIAQKALAGVVGTADIDKVGELLDKAGSDESAAMCQEALKAAIHTLSPDEQGDKVAAMMKSAAKASRFYPVLASTGADGAVASLAAAFTESKTPEAFSALASVDNYKAAASLMDIARNCPEYKETALAAFSDLVARYEQDPDNKIANYAQAIELAADPATRNGILEKLIQLPTRKSFILAGRYLDDEATLFAAADAVRKIASTTKEEIDYDLLNNCLGKASKAYSDRNRDDDGYYVQEIQNALSKAQPAPVSELTAEEKKQGFEMLFDGTSLDKWQGNKDGYMPLNGSMYVSALYGGSGNIYTLKEYRNFVYRFEFCMVREGINNGVGIRTPMGVDAAYEGMCEVQILDHDADMYSGWLAEYQVHGSVYGVIPAKRLVHKPLGEWSTEEIRVEGDHIKVTVNGEVIVDGNVRKACKGHNIAPDGSDTNPYTVDHRNHPGMFNKKGYISFCGHGEGLKIRNVRVLDLDK
ncbi:MAG: DUF1080 domain-containing protein [Bacteroidales bacterium]|nr:DUF1080 domain-containing protein [Bacteroidales bacterium]